VDVHTIYLISGTMLNCVLAFYALQFFFFFFSLLIDPMLLSLRWHNDWSWGQFTTVIMLHHKSKTKFAEC